LLAWQDPLLAKCKGCQDRYLYQDLASGYKGGGFCPLNTFFFPFDLRGCLGQLAHTMTNPTATEYLANPVDI